MNSTRDPLLQALERIIESKVESALARVLSQSTAPNEVSSVRIPADAKNPDAFNRACRSGRVEGARKVGRIWICTLDAWNARRPAERPRGIAKRTKPTKAPSRTPRREPVELRADVLAELGLGTRRTA
jgi:hypothetical protein